MSNLRVGRISALNMYPIYHHLEQVALPGVTFTDGLPSTLNAAVLAGDLDVSAMSSIAYARNADRLRLMPVGCIACKGAVDSIRLLSPVPLDAVIRVAVTPHSASSVTLLRILLGPAVVFRMLTDAPADAIAQGDAVLLIADEALTAHRDLIAPYSIDLGELWQQHTGLPMVFAVWVAREDAARTREAEVARLSRTIEEARQAYLANPDAVAIAATARFPFPAQYISDYLARLTYVFDADERAGLARFLEMARATGELDDISALHPMAA